MVGEPDATMQPTPQDNQLMSKHRVLSFKPQLRLEWRGHDGQNETEQPDHSASLGDSGASSTRIKFLVNTGMQAGGERLVLAAVADEDVPFAWHKQRAQVSIVVHATVHLGGWPDAGVSHFIHYRYPPPCWHRSPRNRLEPSGRQTV